MGNEIGHIEDITSGETGFIFTGEFADLRM